MDPNCIDIGPYSPSASYTNKLVIDFLTTTWHLAMYTKQHQIYVSTKSVPLCKLQGNAPLLFPFTS